MKKDMTILETKEKLGEKFILEAVREIFKPSNGIEELESPLYMSDGLGVWS